MSARLTIRGLVAAPGQTPVLRGVDLTIEPGARAVLVGPSGAGKTTLLRTIAGLEPTVAGTIELGDRRLDATVPAHRRRVAVVFQEPRLLPHARVDDNVALPLRAAGVGRAQRRRQAAARLEEVGLGALATRAVRGLSGGEQQRVALARALCAEPELLALDEPLAALDPNRREALRRLIADVARDRRLTTLVITHDRAEAAELGQTIALMLEGRIVQQASPQALFERPASAAAARFFGVANLLRGSITGGDLRLTDGQVVDGAGGPDGPAVVVIRPEGIGLEAPGTDGTLRGQIVSAVYAGTHIRATIACGGHELVAHVPTAPPVAAGADVGVRLDPVRLWRLPDGAPLSRASAGPGRSAAGP